MKKAMINKIICASLVLGMIASTSVAYATPNLNTKESTITKDVDANTADGNTDVDKADKADTKKTGTVRINTYYTPLDLKYNTPMYYYTPGNTGWKTTSEPMELDLEHTYERYNPDTQNWEPVKLTQTMAVGKYRVIANNYYTAVMSPQEFTVEEGKETTVKVGYTNVDVPTTFTVVPETDAVQVEGLKYIIRNNTGAADKGAELKSGTVENGKVSFTLEKDALYTIEFTNGKVSSSPTLFSAKPGADGTYTSEITVDDFINSSKDDEDADSEGTVEDTSSTGSNGTPNGNTPSGNVPNETINRNAPKTSVQGRDFALMFGVLSVLGLGFVYGKKKEII